MKEVDIIMKLMLVAVIVCFIMVACGSSFAMDKGVSNDPGAKLGAGLQNFLTGWMEIPSRIHEVSQEHNVLAGLTYGTLEGAAYGTGRTVAGGIDTVTFVVPPYDKPIMEPKDHY
ncbi:MAG: exosortase system-associated protein, TIGR04073 family [Candidatus Omnitrophota bacterium]